MAVIRSLLCVFLFVAPAFAQWSPNELKLVVVLSRHGVRSPLSSMSDYAKDPWPDIQKDWGGACCGDLTSRGADLAALMGAYYRVQYTNQRLLPAGCPAKQIYIWADNEQRTIHTAKSLAKGLSGGLPGCDVAVRSLAYNPPDCDHSKGAANCQRGKAGPTDLWFHPLSKLGPPDPVKIEQVVGGINNNYDKLLAKYRPQLQALQNTLGCCNPAKCNGSLPCNLLSLPHQATPGKDGKSVEWNGPFAVGSTASEIFLLGYANGMPCAKVGWNRVIFSEPDCSGPGQSFRAMQEIHTAYFQQTQRDPYIAQIQGSNLANQILVALQQAVKSPGASPQKLVIFAGHDTNIANVAALLKLSWKLPDLPENDTPPAGALVFELYTGQQKGDYFVRVHYVHQNLRQLRTRAVLSLNHPPNWVNVPVPDCGLKCGFPQFERIVQSAIDPRFVTQKPAGD